MAKVRASSDLDRELAKRARRLAQRLALPLEVALYALPVIAAIGFALVGFDGAWLWLAVPPLVLHMLILITQGWWRGVLNNVEATKRALLDDTVAPIVRTAAGMHALEPSLKEERFLRIARQAIDAVLLTIDVHGLRAVIYSLNETSDGLYVVDQNSRGRRSEAGQFPPGEKSTLLILKALAANEPRFEPDNTRQVRRPGREIDYETYISVPIGSDSVSFGMLTVDAPTAGELTKQHINDIELIASALAPAFAELSGARPSARRRRSLGQ
jgi:hypothetical protein